MRSDRKAAPGRKVDCYCRLEKYGEIPHQVSLRTRMRHMKQADELEAKQAATQAAQAQTMDLDNANNHQPNPEVERDYPHEFEGDIRPQDDQEMYDRSDYGPSDDSGPDEGWEHLETPPRAHSPPPSPPQTPPPDDEEPEDDLAHVTAEDYHEYDRWFGEDQHELDEIVLEMLTEEEMDSIKMTAIRLFGHISERNYKRIRYSFRNKVQFMSVYCTSRKLALLSGIKPQLTDCCFNVCHAFTGRFASEEICSTCKEPRYDSKKQPRKSFEYLPMNPRLKGFFNNPEMVNKMSY